MDEVKALLVFAVFLGLPLGMLLLPATSIAKYIVTCLALFLFIFTLKEASHPEADTPPIHLMVPLAIIMLAAYRQWFPKPQKHPSNCCQNCGYNLAGNTTGTCPECGEKI